MPTPIYALFQFHSPEEHLQRMIQMQLPCLHIMYASGDDIEVIVYTGDQFGANRQGSFHYVTLVTVRDVLISVTAEHEFKFQSVLFAVFESLTDTFDLNVMISFRPAASRKRPVPCEKIEIVVKSRSVSGHRAERKSGKCSVVSRFDKIIIRNIPTRICGIFLFNARNQILSQFNVKMFRNILGIFVKIASVISRCHYNTGFSQSFCEEIIKDRDRIREHLEPPVLGHSAAVQQIEDIILL